MFGLGFTEILLILIVALLVFGPKRLPEVARSLGRITGDLRRTLDELRQEVSFPRIDIEEELLADKDEEEEAREKPEQDPPVSTEDQEETSKSSDKA